MVLTLKFSSKIGLLFKTVITMGGLGSHYLI